MTELAPTPEPALTPAMPRRFDHEKLTVYQQSLRFVTWATELLERVPKNLAVHNQLDRASTSIPLNLAEGTAKFTAPDRCRFFDTARGSAVECAACLDVLVAKGVCAAAAVEPGKEVLLGIVSMLMGLLRANAPDRRVGRRTGEQVQVQE